VRPHDDSSRTGDHRETCNARIHPNRKGDVVQTLQSTSTVQAKIDWLGRVFEHRPQHDREPEALPNCRNRFSICDRRKNQVPVTLRRCYRSAKRIQMQMAEPRIHGQSVERSGDRERGSVICLRSVRGVRDRLEGDEIDRVKNENRIHRKHPKRLQQGVCGVFVTKSRSKGVGSHLRQITITQRRRRV